MQVFEKFLEKDNNPTPRQSKSQSQFIRQRSWVMCMCQLINYSSPARVRASNINHEASKITGLHVMSWPKANQRSIAIPLQPSGTGSLRKLHYQRTGALWTAS